MVELPSICLRTMAAGTRWWIRYDVKVTGANGNTVDYVRGRHTCPMVRMYVYGSDGGGLDIVNLFGAHYGQP